MDDLLQEFLMETNESLEQLDVEIIKLEQDPNNPDLLSSIFRMMHTIKGTCGFLGLPRLETLAHAAENVLGKVREGKLAITPFGVSLILEAVDQIKFIVAVLGDDGKEPEGDDIALKDSLNALANGEGDGAGILEESPAPAAIAENATTAVETEEFSEEETPATPEPLQTPTQTPAPKPAPAPVAIEKTKTPAAPSTKEEKPEAKESTQNIRVNVDLLENLMNMVSELVLTRNQLLQISRNHKDNDFSVPLQRLSHVTSELQEGIMKTRMQPIGNAWNKLPRIIRDLSRELDKKIDLVMSGEDTELDRQVLEMIKDPLTHMVRNSGDHGIESPADRKAAGKSETGTIKLQAYHEGGYIIIEISDDGRGLNSERIKEKALSLGLTTPEELAEMSINQIQQFIFKAGFSTAAQVTSVSGRGVGMDVVRTNIEKIGGTIELNSQEGKGSAFFIKIPLTLAIVSALIVGSGGERFAIPQLSVSELVRITPTSTLKIEHINNAPVLRLRERLLPLISLQTLLDLEEAPTKTNSKSMFVVVTRVGANTFGIIVDKVYDTEEIVVKPIAPILRHISVFSGNTILGDGSVIMILDPNGIAASLGQNNTNEPSTEIIANASNNEEKIPLLIFAAGDNAPKAVPLALVSRLEVLDTKTIEYSNKHPLIQYRGSLMPLLRVDTDTATNPESARAEQQPVLVFADGNRAMGLMVDKIIDIVEEVVTINLPSDSAGFIGSAIIKGKATDLIDAHYFINQAFADWFKAEKNPENMKKNARRLLMVDDSAFFRNLLVPVLVAAGYDVTAVESATAALALREKEVSFDLIISDIEMPVMNGFEFAKTLKQSGAWHDIPLIALSSHTSQEIVEQGHAAGFIDYVPKFDRDALLHTITNTLENITTPA